MKIMFSKAEYRVKWDSYISEILKSEFGVVYSTQYPKNLLKEMFFHLASQAGKAVFFYTQAISSCIRYIVTCYCVQGF